MEAQELAGRPHIRLQATRGWAALRLHELWDYRELLYFLVWRDVRIRYRQTALGALWAIIQPFVTMVVFSLFFHTLSNVPSAGDLPYPVFVFAGLLPWQFFARGVALTSGGILNSSGLIRKVYFPRAIVPIAASIGPLVDLFWAFLVLFGLMAYYRLMPTPAILFTPLLILLALVTVNGVGLWLSALSVRFRDVSIVVPFLVQVWMFVTPVIYPSDVLPEPWRTLYGLNPMVGVVEGFRWALLGTAPPTTMIVLSTVVAVALLVSGLFVFRRIERSFADLV
jgi:lipopolysaccharide transport system permease protein